MRYRDFPPGCGRFVMDKIVENRRFAFAHTGAHRPAAVRIVRRGYNMAQFEMHAALARARQRFDDSTRGIVPTNPYGFEASKLRRNSADFMEQFLARAHPANTLINLA